MAKNPLATYLRDHFAGSRLAIDLLGSLKKEHANDPLGELVADLLNEIEEDRAVVSDLIERVGSGQFVFVKESAAILVEKLSWLKLRGRAGNELGTMQALETVAIGIQGKRSLWRTLATIAPEDARLDGIDFERLIHRAENQHARVEAQRLEVARRTLPNRRIGNS